MNESISNCKRKKSFTHESRICLVCCRPHVPNTGQDPESPNVKGRSSVASIQNEYLCNFETGIQIVQ